MSESPLASEHDLTTFRETKKEPRVKDFKPEVALPVRVVLNIKRVGWKTFKYKGKETGSVCQRKDFDSFMWCKDMVGMSG